MIYSALPSHPNVGVSLHNTSSLVPLMIHDTNDIESKGKKEFCSENQKKRKDAVTSAFELKKNK